MKLLLGENLSRRLVPALQSRFPGSEQVALLGLERATDAELCDFAAREGFVICSHIEDLTPRPRAPTAIRRAAARQQPVGNLYNDQAQRTSELVIGAGKSLKVKDYLSGKGGLARSVLDGNLSL